MAPVAATATTMSAVLQSRKSAALDFLLHCKIKDVVEAEWVNKMQLLSGLSGGSIPVTILAKDLRVAAALAAHSSADGFCTVARLDGARFAALPVELRVPTYWQVVSYECVRGSAAGEFPPKTILALADLAVQTPASSVEPYITFLRAVRTLMFACGAGGSICLRAPSYTTPQCTALDNV